MVERININLLFVCWGPSLYFVKTDDRSDALVNGKGAKNVPVPQKSLPNLPPPRAVSDGQFVCGRSESTRLNDLIFLILCDCAGNGNKGDSKYEGKISGNSARYTKGTPSLTVNVAKSILVFCYRKNFTITKHQKYFARWQIISSVFNAQQKKCSLWSYKPKTFPTSSGHNLKARWNVFSHRNRYLIRHGPANLAKVSIRERAREPWCVLRRLGGRWFLNWPSVTSGKW